MVSEIGSPWRLNMLPQVQVLGGVYPGDNGHGNPGAVCGPDTPDHGQ